jgi:hypothetical protein
MGADPRGNEVLLFERIAIEPVELVDVGIGADVLDALDDDAVSLDPVRTAVRAAIEEGGGALLERALSPASPRSVEERLARDARALAQCSWSAPLHRGS